jgi:hypothetical protein
MVYDSYEEYLEGIDPCKGCKDMDPDCCPCKAKQKKENEEILNESEE